MLDYLFALLFTLHLFVFFLHCSALPNPLITDTTDICLIVPDLVRGRNVDHEKTYHHYKDLLDKNGIKNIKTVSYGCVMSQDQLTKIFYLLRLLKYQIA